MSIAPASSRGDRCWVGNRALEKGLPLTGLPESDSHGLLGGVGPKPSRIKSCGGARVNKFRRKRVLAITVKKGAKERYGFFRFHVCSVEPAPCACQAMKDVGKPYVGKLHIKGSILFNNS